VGPQTASYRAHSWGEGPRKDPTYEMRFGEVVYPNPCREEIDKRFMDRDQSLKLCEKALILGPVQGNGASGLFLEAKGR